VELLNIVRPVVATAIAIHLLSGCAGSGARPLTPEEKAQQESDKLRRDLRPELCNEALNAAREYKEGTSGMGDPKMSRCGSARP
jgi:hypothetical protein